MTVTIVGSQLGDEGKGGIVDVWGDAADVVARYQGGDNAGHTVVEDGTEYKLSLVPSGAVRDKVGVLGNGCVVNPATLFDEIDGLRERGLDPDVRVARRAHVILPYHRVLDGIEETVKSDSDRKVGTTGRGIGPTYEDKVGRRGIRVGDLLDPEILREKLEYVVPQKRALAEDAFGVSVSSAERSRGKSESSRPSGDDVSRDSADHSSGRSPREDEANGGSSDGSDGVEAGEEFDVDALYEEYKEYGNRLREENMTVNSGEFLADRIDGGDDVMFEGAQGTAIDIDHGNYPYVTSSNPTAGYAATGTGVGPTTVGRGEVVGIVKAYLSRVGSGPLPTELKGDDESEDLAEYIREEGGEYGTVTGRPRRVGWLDVPMLRHAARANGFTGLAINHIDVLAGLDEVKVGHSYDLDTEERSSSSNRTGFGDVHQTNSAAAHQNAERSEDGEEIFTMPATTERWAACEPNFRTFDGWDDVDWSAVAEQGYDAIPENARTYLEYVGDELDADVYAVGVGPGRDETVVLENPFE